MSLKVELQNVSSCLKDSPLKWMFTISIMYAFSVSEVNFPKAHTSGSRLDTPDLSVEVPNLSCFQISNSFQNNLAFGNQKSYNHQPIIDPGCCCNNNMLVYTNSVFFKPN